MQSKSSLHLLRIDTQEQKQRDITLINRNVISFPQANSEDLLFSPVYIDVLLFCENPIIINKSTNNIKEIFHTMKPSNSITLGIFPFYGYIEKIGINGSSKILK